MAELDGRKVAAVLAADTKLDVRADALAVVNSQLDQSADALLIEACKRIGLEDLLLEVGLEDAADVVTGEAVGHLGQVVGTEGEELSLFCDLVRGDCCTRGLDHGTYHILHLQAGSLDQLVSLRLDYLLNEAQLVDLGNQRNHDLRRDAQVVFLPDVDGSGDNRLGLHLSDFRIENVQTAAAGAEHRVELVQALDLGLQLLERNAHLAGQLLNLVVLVREELVERRVKQADGYRQTAHCAVDCLEVAALHRQDLRQSGLALLERVSDDHLANRLDTGRLEEHMLGTAQADAFRAELACLRSVARRIAVGADVQGTDLVSPAHEAAEVAGQLSFLRRDSAEVNVAGRAVERDNVAFLGNRAVGERDDLVLFGNLDAVYAGNTAGAHAACNNGCVRGHAAACGHDALGNCHAVDVLRGGLLTDQNDLEAGLVCLCSSVSGEVNRAAGSTGRCRQAGGNRGSGLQCFRIEGRMQQCVELLRLYLHDSLLLGAYALVYEVNCNLERCLSGTLAVTGLEHIELAVFDGELHILHIAVVLLEAAGNVNELIVNLRHGVGQCGNRLRGADACYNVLALCVHQELAVQLLLAGCRVTGKCNAGARSLAHVAEYHRLNVDCGAPGVRNVIHAAVGVGTRVVPGAEYCADSFHQLLLGVLREVLAEGLLIVVLEQNDELGHIVCIQLVVHLDALLVLDLVDELLEGGLRQLHYDVGEHLDEAAVRVACETRIVRQLSNGFADLVIHAEVQDGVHHAGHGSARTGTNRYEQRLLSIAEGLAGDLFELIEIFEDLFLDIRVDGLAIFVVTGAGFGGDGKALRNGHAETGHFCQVRALAAEQLTHFAIAFREHVNIFLHCGSFLHSVDALFLLTLQSHNRIIARSAQKLLLWDYTELPNRSCIICTIRLNLFVFS